MTYGFDGRVTVKLCTQSGTNCMSLIFGLSNSAVLILLDNQTNFSCNEKKLIPLFFCDKASLTVSSPEHMSSVFFFFFFFFEVEYKKNNSVNENSQPFYSLITEFN